MKLDTIEISNFRCFDSFVLKADGSSLFLVSENAAGKSSLLLAILKALGKDRSATAADFADDKVPIEIVATLSGFDPGDQAVFPKELSFKGRPTLRIGFRAVWDAKEKEAEVTVGFPDHAWKAAARDQRDAVRTLWLAAYRDPSKALQLASKRGFLADLLSKLKLDTSLSSASVEISQALQKLSAVPDIVGLLGGARGQLSKLIPGVDPNAFGFGFEGNSSQDLLSEFELLMSHGGPQLPIGRQSNGLGQLAVFVFALAALANDPKAILLVDEPEISLHPQAQRALVSGLRGLPNQSFVATHSSNILDRTDLRTIVRLSRKAGKVTPARASGLSDPDAERLARFVSPQTSEACFGRKVVVVEGYSDRVAILRLAKRLGRDFDAEGTTVLSLDGGSGISSHLQLFGQSGLALELFGLCDEDKEAHWQKELQKAGIPANDRATMKANGFMVCVKDLEQEFIRAIGLAGVQAVIAAEGEAATFATFTKQPSQAGKPADEQLRAFLHKDNIGWMVPLVDALDLKAIPGPLNELISRI